MVTSEKKNGVVLVVLICSLLLCSFASLFMGDISLSFKQLFDVLTGQGDELMQTIVWQIRFPKMITALLAGGGLAIAGLLMQTFFQNALAGPFVLGINSGASLGISLWLMGSSLLGDWIRPFIPFGSLLFSIAGSFLILFILLLLSFKIQGKVILLVMGLLFGHLANGLINIFISVGQLQQIKTFLLWGLGSFARVDVSQLPYFSLFMIAAILLAFTQVKKLNLMLLGERYALSLGLNLKRSRLHFIALTGILSGLVCAYCGPIAFLGVMGPHLARAVIRTSDHRYLLPASFFMGAIVAVGADALCVAFSGEVIPLNAMMGILGAPVIIFFLWNKRHGEMA